MSAQTAQRDRWWVIAAYALVASANQLLWLTFTPVTTPSAHFYGVSVSDIGWLSEIFPLLYVVLGVPAPRRCWTGGFARRCSPARR